MWVTCQIFVRTKLRRVNEDARQEFVVLLTSLPHKRKVPFVEISHCSNKADLCGASPSRAFIHHLVDRGDYSHPSSAPVSLLSGDMIPCVIINTSQSISSEREVRN